MTTLAAPNPRNVRGHRMRCDVERFADLPFNRVARPAGERVADRAKGGDRARAALANPKIDPLTSPPEPGAKSASPSSGDFAHDFFAFTSSGVRNNNRIEKDAALFYTAPARPAPVAGSA